MVEGIFPMQFASTTIELMVVFLAGAGIDELANFALREHRDRAKQQPMVAPQAPAGVHCPEPRREALAILDLCDWNFAAAYDWSAEMMKLDPDFIDFWIEVSRCIEIFQAGKRKETPRSAEPMA